MLAILATLAPMASGGRGCAGLAIPVDMLLVAVDSASVLLFPTIRRFSPGDLLVGVRMVIVNFVKMLFAVLATAVAGLAFLAVKLLLRDQPLLPFAVSWLILIGEGLLTVWATALLFKLRPSEHGLEGRCGAK